MWVIRKALALDWQVEGLRTRSNRGWMWVSIFDLEELIELDLAKFFQLIELDEPNYP
jgi:hypothetical protein